MQRATDFHDHTSVHEAADLLARSPAPANDQHEPSMLYRYAGWQRAVQASIANGHDDWFERAHHNGDRYALPARASKAG